MGQALELDNAKQLLKQYYAGQRIASPSGGFLMLLGIRPAEKGAAVAIFECSVSSLRYEIQVPKATRAEKKAVKDQLEEGRDPHCPRHGPGNRLTRAGKELVCRACGVAYGKA